MSDGASSSPVTPTTPVLVVERADPKVETVYRLKGDAGRPSPMGVRWAATAVDAGQGQRSVELVLVPESTLAVVRPRLGELLGPLAALGNSNLGVAEALVTVAGQLAVVLSVLDGLQLDDLAEESPLPARVAAEVGLELAWGLAAAHNTVMPDEIKPRPVPHGALSAGAVVVSGSGEVVLSDFNLHACSGGPGSVADDVADLARVIVHAIDGRPMAGLPPDEEAARQAIADDLGDLEGVSHNLRVLLGEMLDPAPQRRPAMRAVARSLRRLISEQDGVWLSAWAEDRIGLPESTPPALPMPMPALMAEVVEDDSDSYAPRLGSAQRQSKQVEDVPPLIKRGRDSTDAVRLRFSPWMVGLLVGGTLLAGGGFALKRFWLDIHGPNDGPDVATEQAGPDKAARAGPATMKARDDEAPEDEQPMPAAEGSEPGGATILEQEAGIDADDGRTERPDRELVETDDRIRPGDDGVEAGAELPQDAVVDGEDSEASEGGGPQPWPRPEGTLGAFDLFVEVPMANGLRVSCDNGLVQDGPSPFRVSILQSTPARCLVTGVMRGERPATAVVRLDRSLDLVCRHGFEGELRCVDRPSGRDVRPEPVIDPLDDGLSDLRVRVPLARSVDVVCAGGERRSGIDVEWLEFSDVREGSCTVSAQLPDGAYGATFPVSRNAEFLCLRDFSGPTDPATGRRPLRCGEASRL